MRMKYLGIDIGSTSVKSAVFDLSANQIVTMKKTPSPSRISHPNPRFFEVPAQQYLAIVRRTIDEMLALYADIEGLVLSVQMHGFVLDGTYISWQDSRCLDLSERGSSYIEELRCRIPPDDMEACGVYLKPSLGLCNFYAKLCQEKTLDQPHELYTLGSYLISQLTGKNICHKMSAAPFGLLDLKSTAWRFDLLSRMGIEHLRLPAIAAQDFEPCGIYTSSGRSIKIFPDYGDQQVSILGSGAQKSDVVVNIATASQVSSFSDSLQFGAWELRPYFDNSYIKVISNMPAGRNLEVLFRFVQDAAQFVTGKPQPIEQIRSALSSLELHTFAPALTVDMTFYSTQDQLTGGSITGIHENNFTLENVFSAAYTNMAQTYWKNILRLQKSKEIRAIVCAGGVSWKSSSLLDAIQAVTNKPCVRSAYPDEAVQGLFLAAQRCAGTKISMSKSKKPDQGYGRQ